MWYMDAQTAAWFDGSRGAGRLSAG